MIPTPTKRRHYQQQEYPAQDEVEEDGEEEDEDDGNEDNDKNSEAREESRLFNDYSIKKCCLNNQQQQKQQVPKDNQCCGQLSDLTLNNDEGEEMRDGEEGEILDVVEDEEEDFDYLRLDTIVEEDENSDMEDGEDLGHLDDDDDDDENTDNECDNSEVGKIVTKRNQRLSRETQQGKASGYASMAPNIVNLLHEERASGQKEQKINGNSINNNNVNGNSGGSNSGKVRPLAEHNGGGNLLMNSMRKFSATSANDYQTKDFTATAHRQQRPMTMQQGDENNTNKEIFTTKQSIQDGRNDSNCISSSMCDKLVTPNKKMQNSRQQQQQNQIHQPLPSTNRLISEHQARQQQALFRALAERQKMMDEIGADGRIDLMSTASLNALRQQQQKQQQNRRKKRRSRGSVGDRKLNKSSKVKADGPSSSSSTEDGVPLSAVDLSSMSDRMLDELLGHIASASSSSLSSNGESLDSSDLSSGNTSDELDEGSQRFRSDITTSAAAEQSNTAIMRAHHNRNMSSNRPSDTPNIIGVHEDERTNGCLIALNNDLQANSNNHFVKALNNKAKRQLNCRNTHRRSCDNEDDQNDDDEDDDDNNPDHELVVHLNAGSDQLHDSSLSPINNQVSEQSSKNKPNDKSSKLEEYFTSGLVNPHEISDQGSCESPESVTPAKLTAIGRQQVITASSTSKQVPTNKITTTTSRTAEAAATKATSVATNSKQSVEEVLSQMLSALNEISADDQEQLNDLLERGFTHLEQLLNCNLGGSNSTNSSISGASITNQLSPTSATTFSTANSNNLNQRQKQQYINSGNSPLRSQLPNNMAQKLISNQQQQQQQYHQLHQTNAATLSKDSDYGSDTQSADCLSHYNDSSASSNEHSNITNVNTQSNNRWTMLTNSQAGDVQSSESPSPTSLTTTTSTSSSSSAASAHHSSSTSSSPIIGTKSSQAVKSAARATLVTTSAANQTTSPPSQSMSTLSPLAIELSFKLAESLHRLAQQQAATRREGATNIQCVTGGGTNLLHQQEQPVASGEERISNSNPFPISSNGNECVNLSTTSESIRQSDIEKKQENRHQQAVAGSNMQKVVAPQQVAAQKKSPMKSIVMINAARSPSAASIVSTSSSNDFICGSGVKQQQQLQQQQRNLTPVQGDMSSSSSKEAANISQRRQQVVTAPTATKQQFKTCVSIGSATSSVSNVVVGSPISTPSPQPPTTALARGSEDRKNCQETTTTKTRKTKKRAPTSEPVNDFDGSEDVKSNSREVKCEDIEVVAAATTITTENNSKQQVVITSAAANFERARSSRSSLRRRPSFSGSTCGVKEPGVPRPGSPVPRLLLEEPRGLNHVNHSDKMSSINNSSIEASNNSLLVTENKRQQKQLQRALILAQKYNYSPTKLAASKLSSKLQLKDLTTATANSSSYSTSPAINGSQTLNNQLGNGVAAVDPNEQDQKRTTSETSRYMLNNGTLTTGKTNILQQHPIRVSGKVELDISYFAKSGSLTVHVLQCFQLAPVSKRRTTSNPYVKLYLLPDRSKNGKRKSSIHKFQLNPKFDEKFTFGPLQLGEFDDKILWLSVWHKDRLGRNEFLGEILIPLSQIRHQLLTSDFCQSTSPKWYQLRERFEASASIKQQEQRQFNWQQTSQLNDKAGSRTKSGQQWYTTREDNDSLQQPSWSSSTTPRNGKLNQGFHGVKEMKETAATSANRLQVDLLESGKQPYSQVDVVDKLGELQRKAFRLTSAVAPPVGLTTQQMSVHLGPLTQLNSNQSHSISGQLFVALKFVPENQELIPSRVSRDVSGELHVIIKEAHNIGGFEATQLLSTLNDKDSNQSVGKEQQQQPVINKPPSGPLPNPFCKCYLLASNGQRIGKQKTPHVKRTANPRWDFKCIFNSVKLSQLTCQAIEILMFNRDSILVSNNDYLGGIRLCQASKTCPSSTTNTVVDKQTTLVGSDSITTAAVTTTTTTTTATTQTGKVNEALQDEALCSERESRLWNQMLARPNIWVYGELRLRQLRPLIAAVNNVENCS